MHLSRNRTSVQEKVQKGVGGYMFLIKGRNFEWEVEWERVDPMEENNMRTITSDGNTQQQTKSKVNYLKASSFITFILQIFIPPRQSKFVLSILNALKLRNC